MPGRLLEPEMLISPSPTSDATMATNQRASGRVRKQPELFTSSDYTTSKRKRSNEEDEDVDADGDREMPEDNVSDEAEEDDEDEELDEEELRERKKQARKAKSAAPKKPAQKKPKVNGTSLPFRNAAGGSKKRAAPKKAKAVNTEEAVAAGGLYAEVFASGHTLDDIAGNWLKRFEDHESNALAEVVNFVLKCAGCNTQVSAVDVEDPDAITSKVDDIREEYQATEPTDYPLIAKGKTATSVRQGLTGFFNALIRAMAISRILYNNTVLLENVQNWISTMSSAPNRSFRHTATVASLSITTALCEVARDNAETIANHQRHADTERKKKNVNAARVRDLENKVKEATAQQEFLEPQLEDWFNVIWIHRYRDVDPIVRRDCIHALGDWVVIMPDAFFDGNHLRYMGWMMSDSSAATRGEVIQQLARLYKQKDRLGGLKTFTEKFRPRMVEIATTDAEVNVRISGIVLIDLLRENELLEPDDIDAVGRLIFDTEPRIRKAVAAFFSENVNDVWNAKIDELGGAENLEEALPEIGEGNHEAPHIEWLKLKSLAELLQNYDENDALPSHVERIRADGTLTLHVVKVSGEPQALCASFVTATNVPFGRMIRASLLPRRLCTTRFRRSRSGNCLPAIYCSTIRPERQTGLRTTPSRS
jgi:cohesin complex subunit SA-1/2